MKYAIQLQAATDAALTAMLLQHGLLILAEGAPRLADGVVYSHIGGATLEGGEVPLAGRYAFISVDDARFGASETAALITALDQYTYKGPPLRMLLGVANANPAAPWPVTVGSAREAKIRQINAECERRIVERFGPWWQQINTVSGLNGSAALAAMTDQTSGINAYRAASNAAQNAILAATTIAQVEAVTVTWPVI